MQQGQPWSVYSGQVLTTILCWLHFELQGTQIRQIPQELQGTQIELPRKKKMQVGSTLITQDHQRNLGSLRHSNPAELMLNSADPAWNKPHKKRDIARKQKGEVGKSVTHKQQCYSKTLARLWLFMRVSKKSFFTFPLSIRKQILYL